jgi:hypothetical protein
LISILLEGEVEKERKGKKREERRGNDANEADALC